MGAADNCQTEEVGKMTRNRELRCEDIFGCDHTPETPIVEEGEIVYWMCRCGRRHYPKSEDAVAEQDACAPKGERK